MMAQHRPGQQPHKGPITRRQLPHLADGKGLIQPLAVSKNRLQDGQGRFAGVGRLWSGGFLFLMARH